MTMNLQIKLAHRPKPGLLTADDFQAVEAAIPEPGAGEFRVRVKCALAIYGR